MQTHPQTYHEKLLGDKYFFHYFHFLKLAVYSLILTEKSPSVDPSFLFLDRFRKFLFCNLRVIWVLKSLCYLEKSLMQNKGHFHISSIKSQNRILKILNQTFNLYFYHLGSKSKLHSLYNLSKYPKHPVPQQSKQPSSYTLAMDCIQ